MLIDDMTSVLYSRRYPRQIQAFEYSTLTRAVNSICDMFMLLSLKKSKCVTHSTNASKISSTPFEAPAMQPIRAPHRSLLPRTNAVATHPTLTPHHQRCLFPSSWPSRPSLTLAPSNWKALLACPKRKTLTRLMTLTYL